VANDQTMHERLTPSAPPGEGAPAPIRVQILATEHWSLLATRGMTYNEIFSRTGIFLTVVSASVVALALVAQATEFGDGFYVFALLVLPVVLFLGLGTQLRVRDAVAEDVWLVLGMNRLRHAYLEMAPELEPYFVTSHHDDERGIMQNYGPWARVRPSRLLASTPVLVGVIDPVIAGVIAGLVAEVSGAAGAVSIAIGTAVTLAALALLVFSATRVIQELRTTWVPRFPRAADEEAHEPPSGDPSA
jgi:hypothetical protein